ncbi:DUF3048 domain-containing protein [Metabacillus arenae]|uniref:DUF3048 domain-containing protein n=1 Tax=Metabacillus arenae TaxID=2771434 RepID=A0A926NLX7_9BACI|nr:DUF3048 domain-containing protein [Metabacillus arenae]MBD1382373.1 DUF3048 domain-containing protein [Metabacillus arenae]
MKWRWVFLLTFVFIFLNGCNNEDPEAGREQEPQQEKNVTETEEEAAFYPLSGEAAEGKINQRPVAVMVNNHPKARPQSGLHEADVVYEVLAEGEVTRFLAIYQSKQPEIIGPVRSARDYYVDLSKGFNSIYVSHGWSPGAQEKLESGEADFVNGLFYDGSLFWRADHAKAPHNSYTSYKNILKGAEKDEISTEGSAEPFTFYTEEELSSIEGEKVDKVSVPFGKSKIYESTYQYNKSLNKYERLSNGEQTIDRETKDPVLISNVFIVEANHDIKDQQGRRTIDLESGGQGLLLQGGGAKGVNWENRDGRIVPVSAGELVKFVPGMTWICIVPDYSMITIEPAKGE